MIVRDEELNIKRALESVKDIADEIIVVDTGSVDKTVEIARQYTDKIYFHQWEGDFSKARNYSLKYATCKWVMILDADEEVSEEFRKNVREFLERLPEDVNTVIAPSINYLGIEVKNVGIFSLPRIFRNGTVYYKYKVHNQPVYKEKTVYFDREIYHYGYMWSDTKRRKKYLRSRKLIIEEMENAKDKIMRLYYKAQLCKIELAGKKDALAVKTGDEFFREIEKLKPDETPMISVNILSDLTIYYNRTANYTKMFKAAKKILELDPRFPDVYITLAIHYYNQGSMKKFREMAEKFLEKYELYKKIAGEVFWMSAAPSFVQSIYLLKVTSFLKEKNIYEFKECLNRALKAETTSDSGFGLSQLLKQALKIEDKPTFEQVFPELTKLSPIVEKLRMGFDDLLFKALEFGMSVDKETIEKLPVRTKLGELAKKRLTTGEDLLMELILNDKEPIEFIKKHGYKGLLLLYYVMDEMNTSIKERARFLNGVLKEEDLDNQIKSVASALLADVFVKAKNLQMVAKYLRQSLQYSEDFAKILEPLVDDVLVATSTVHIEGTLAKFKRFFLPIQEFFLPPDEFLDSSSRKYAHLLSDIDLAKYISAVEWTKKDPKKALEILEKIDYENKQEDFPMYKYQMYRIFKELKDFEKAKNYLQEALFENPKLANLTLGGSPEYIAVYAEKKNELLSDKDRLLTVINISEKFPVFELFNPIREIYYKEAGVYYAGKVPTIDPIKEYLKKGIEPTENLDFPLEDVVNALYRAEIQRFSIEPRILVERKAFETMKENLQELGFEISENAGAVVILHAEILSDEELLKLLKGKSTALIFSLVPDRPDSSVFYYPLALYMRQPRYMKNLLKKAGLSARRFEPIGSEKWLFEAVRREK